jgi:hypothetical protein
MVLVLGDDKDVSESIKESLKTRYRGQEKAYQIASHEDRLINFESNCHALGVPVCRWKHRPWKRLLSLAHKVLTGGSLMQYGPKPADQERQAVALCMAKGIGEKTATALIKEYGSIANLCTASLQDLSTFKQDGRKIGQAKAESIIRLLHSGLVDERDVHMVKA